MYDCFEVLIPIEEIWCSPYQGFDFVIVMGVIAMIPDLKRRQQELGTEENNSQPQDSQAERNEIMPVAPRKSILRRLFHCCYKDCSTSAVQTSASMESALPGITKCSAQAFLFFPCRGDKPHKAESVREGTSDEANLQLLEFLLFVVTVFFQSLLFVVFQFFLHLICCKFVLLNHIYTSLYSCFSKRAKITVLQILSWYQSSRSRCGNSLLLPYNLFVKNNSASLF